MTANVKTTNATHSATEQTPVEATTVPVKKGKKDAGLPPELTELVAELKATVKSIDPRKHTPKTLRRALSLVGDVLGDIDRLTTPKP
jgi:hypothetical protein